MKTKIFSLVIALAMLGTSFALPTPMVQCPEGEFACGDADELSCIPLEWVCDNVKDCRRGKDEANCNYLHTCPDGDFMCKSGECVSAKFKCNGLPDCSDGSDETACISATSTQPPKDESSVSPPVHQIFKKVSCSFGEFHCEKSNKCISKYKVCNGMADCEYMEDELDCAVGCPDGKLRCEDGPGCYSKCDGYEECADGSDELGCDYNDLPSMDAFFNDHFHGCGHDEFKCSANECVPKAKLCDGFEDCSNGADEGGLCGDCATYECAHKCRDSPNGPECYCPEGSFLTVDFKTCDQANPCADEGASKCSQFCRPKGSSTACQCADGYHLNGTSLCEVDNEHMNGELFLTAGGSSLRRMPLFNISGTYYEEVASHPDWKISSISVNPKRDTINFVANEGHHKSYVYETKRTGGAATKFLSAIDLKDIAVDWTTGNIFYTAEGPYPGLGVCTSDGLFCKQLVDGEYKERGHFTQRYGGLIVHPQRGLLIYVSYNAEHPEGVVRLVGMDGSNDRILSHQVNRPKVNSIAMDYVRDYLFVSEEPSTVLYDLHTLKTEVMDVPVLAKAGLIFNGQFYFIGRDSKLRNAKLMDSAHDVVHTLAVADSALAINNSIYYPNVTNLCLEANCSHICVLTEKQIARCLCPDQYQLDETTGQCEPTINHGSRVKLSTAEMEARCSNEAICRNGGFCAESYDEFNMSSPSCSCTDGYYGLYCEIKHPSPLNDSASSSGWMTFLYFMLFLVASLVVTYCLLSKFYPEYTRIIKDRVQHRFSGLSPQLRRVNATFGKRPPVVPLAQNDVNAQVSSLATPTKSYSTTDLSKSSFLNPVFGSSPALAKGKSQESTPSLHKSPSADFKLNIEE